MAINNNTSDSSNITSPIGFVLYIWPLGTFYILGEIISIFGNSMILIALAVSPELRKNRCNIFVTNLAASELIMNIYGFQAGFRYIIATLKGPASLSMYHNNCFYMEIPVIMACNAGAITILATGIDRTIALVYPLFYKNLTAKYTFILICVSWMYGVVNVAIGWVDINPMEVVSICALPTALKHTSALLWSYGNTTINVVVVFTYGVAYWKARKMAKFRNAANDMALKNNRLLASLVIFVCIYVSSAFLGNILTTVANTAFTDVSIVVHISMYSGMLALCGAGCNFFIYYSRSSEYRQVFRRILHMKPSQVSISIGPTSTSRVVREK